MTNDDALSATEKTLLVLEAALTYARLGDVAAATGLAKSTVHRIAKALVDRGFVVMTGDGSYAPGPKALLLAGRALEQLDISALAEDQIARLVRESGCTVHVGVLSGDEVVYLVRRDSEKPYRMPSRVGKAIWLHCSAMGKAIYAEMPAEQRAAILGRTGLPCRTPNTIDTPGKLRVELNRIRERGFAIDDEENEPGIRCVGAAVHDHTGRATYGVSISTLSLEHSVADLIAMAPLVTRAAEEISTAIGYQPTPARLVEVAPAD